jgi:hypothetical protein
MHILGRTTIIGILAMAALCTAGAHGDWPPKYGGLMNEGGETSFELVVQGVAIVLHVEDHGTPIITAGAEGTFAVTRAGITWAATLVPAGDNRLQTVLPQPLEQGDKVLARVKLANGSIVAGRFDYR